MQLRVLRAAAASRGPKHKEDSIKQDQRQQAADSCEPSHLSDSSIEISRFAALEELQKLDHDEQH